MGAGAAIGGGLLGGILGAVSGKEGGTDAGNLYAGSEKGMQPQDMRARLSEAIERTRNMRPEQYSAAVKTDPLLSQVFGKGGTFERTGAEEQRLADQGFQLTPEDKTAYGQGAAQIARQFGQREKGLAESLASRGLSQSGAAGAEFTGLAGNKDEQLGRLQMDIANQRMKNTTDRLAQTRQFLGQLGSQGLAAQGQFYGQDLARNQAGYQQNMGWLQAMQNQQNEKLQQQQQTAQPSKTGQIFGGIMQGASMGGGLASSMGGAKGGMAGGGGGTEGLSGNDYFMKYGQGSR